MHFTCTKLDFPSKMFTVGKTYCGMARENAMPNNIAYTVVDNLGHKRILLNEPNCRFIINNPCMLSNDRIIPDYAYFSVSE